MHVIIVNWNGRQLLSDCLKALRGQLYRQFYVTVVDNGSSDGSRAMVKKDFPEVNLIDLDHNSGFAVANNIALKEVRCTYAALLNNDTIAHPAWLQTLVSALDRHPQAGMAATKMCFIDDPQVIDRAGDGYTRAGTAQLRGRNAPASAYQDLEWIFGACAGAALYRTSMLRDIGLFDEDFFLLYEDVDLSFRAQLKGYRCLFVPDAIVYHHASRSIGRDTETAVYYSHRNLEWVYLKNVPKQLLLASLPAHFIYILASFAFFLLNGRGTVYLRAKRDAWHGRKRVFAQRRQIQRQARVTAAYIYSLWVPETLFQRLLRRRNQ